MSNSTTTRARAATGVSPSPGPATAKRVHRVTSKAAVVNARRARNITGTSARNRKEVAAILAVLAKATNLRRPPPLPLASYASAGEGMPFMIPYPRGIKVFVLEPETSSPLERETLWNTQFNGRRSASGSVAAIDTIGGETKEPRMKPRGNVSFAEGPKTIESVDTNLADATRMLHSTAL